MRNLLTLLFLFALCASAQVATAEIPVAVLPTAATAQTSVVYQWTGGTSANVCPASGASGSGGSVVVYCVTYNNSNWTVVAHSNPGTNGFSFGGQALGTNILAATGTILFSNNAAATAIVGDGIDVVNDGTGASGGAIAVVNYGVSGVTNSPGFFGVAARGTLAVPAAVQADDVLASYAARGYFGLGFASASAASVRLVAGETWGNTTRETYIQFNTTPHGSTAPVERMRIFGSGGVSIGNTVDPGTGILSVQAGITTPGPLTFNGAAFAGTSGDLVSFGASNTPADSGIVASTLSGGPFLPLAGGTLAGDLLFDTSRHYNIGDGGGFNRPFNGYFDNDVRVGHILSIVAGLNNSGPFNNIFLTAPATTWTIQPAADNQTTTIPGGTLVSLSGGTFTGTVGGSGWSVTAAGAATFDMSIAVAGQALGGAAFGVNGAIVISSNPLAVPVQGQGIDVIADGTPVDIVAVNYGVNGATNSPGFHGIAARGSLASPAAVQANDLLLSIGARGYTGSAFTTGSAGGFEIRAGETWTSGNQGSYMAFRSTANGTNTSIERMRLFGSGGVSIGNTVDPGTGILSVQAGITTPGPLTFNGAAFAGTSGDLVSFGASNTPADSGIVASTLSGGPFLPLTGGALTGLVTSNRGAIGSIPTDALLQTNTTAAAAGAQQFSPGLNQTGQGWVLLNAPGAVTSNAPTSGGSCTAGTHVWAATFINATGETTIGTSSASQDCTTNHTEGLTAIPLGPSGTTGRNIYRSKAGTTTPLYLDCASSPCIADNSTTTFSDTLADGSLGAASPGSNTTGNSQSVSFRTFVTPVQGTTGNGDYWGLWSNVNGAGYNNIIACQANGFCGIGTTAPGRQLTVSSSAAVVASFVSSAGGAHIRLYNNGDAETGGVELISAATTGNSSFTSHGTNAIGVAGNPAIGLQLDTSGNVSITGLKTTGSASGKTLVCGDVTTGTIYLSTSAVTCAN